MAARKKLMNLLMSGHHGDIDDERMVIESVEPIFFAVKICLQTIVKELLSEVVNVFMKKRALN